MTKLLAVYGTMLLAIGMFICAPLYAQTCFQAALDGLQEVPPTPSPATGTATLTLNAAQTQVSYNISFSGLVGVETLAYFHNAGPGMNGGAIFALPLGSPKIGVWPVTAFEAGELLAGRIYVNIHTTEWPGGEIRGDISFSSASATEPTSWSRVKSLWR
jgi:hypothetical protein